MSFPDANVELSMASLFEHKDKDKEAPRYGVVF